MGPAFAAREFRARYPECDSVKVTLFGSLAKTGEGHGTDRVIREELDGLETEIIFNTSDEVKLEHPNTLLLEGYAAGDKTAEMTVLSVGGGEIVIVGDEMIDEDGDGIPDDEVYSEKTFSEIAEICKSRNIRLSDYVFEHEDAEFKRFLGEVWHTMSNSIREGLIHTGMLPGGLELERKAQKLYNQRHIDESPQTRENRLVCAYAFAVSEQNADCGKIVTAPTCGSCGVLPAVLKYMEEKNSFTEDDIFRALAVAGLIGNIVATNASVSGAECGCQAEIGTACSMAAAALAVLHGN